MNQAHIQYIDVGQLEEPDLCGWEGPGWYFWDETQATCYGPYRSYLEAEEALNHYVIHVLGV